MVERIRTLLESRQLTPTQFADVIGVARPIVSHILSGRNKPSLEVVQRILAAMPDLAMPWLLNGTGPMLAGGSAAPLPSGDAMIAVASAAPRPVAVMADEQRTQANVHAAAEAPASSRQHAEQQPASTAMPIAAPLRASTTVPNRNQVVPKRFVASAVSLDASPQAQQVAPSQPQPLAVTAGLPQAAAAVQGNAAYAPISSPTPLAEVPATTTLPPPVPGDEKPGAALASALFAGGDKPIRRIVIFYRDGSFADYQPE
ncbi:hypothetical protein GCM10028822_04710 [Hymenobacter terrigena]